MVQEFGTHIFPKISLRFQSGSDKIGFNCEREKPLVDGRNLGPDPGSPAFMDSTVTCGSSVPLVVSLFRITSNAPPSTSPTCWDGAPEPAV